MTESHDTIDVDELEFDDITTQVVSRGTRFAHYIIDWFAGMLPSILISNYVFYGTFSFLMERQDKQLEVILLQWLLYVLYYLLFEYITGKTLGKAITGTKVVNASFGKPTFTQILGRTFARLIPFEAFSFFGEKGIGWHDSLSKTYVIKA